MNPPRPNTNAPVEVYCPHCGKRTNHIQSYAFPVIIVAAVYVVWHNKGQRVANGVKLLKEKMKDEVRQERD